MNPGKAPNILEHLIFQFSPDIEPLSLFNLTPNILSCFNKNSLGKK